ncbi:MAG: T9SS type A sorting domain-containing protein [Ignavibacteria bacterium]|nr:T9SS type A sorting domain-containing protein [Ignavibacteria bacterium]
MKRIFILIIGFYSFTSFTVNSQWLPMNSGMGSGTIVHGFLFGSADIVWMYGSNYSGATGFLKYSTDGGSTFTSQSYSSTSGVWGGYMANASTGWIVTKAGEIIKTTNAGGSWQLQVSGTSSELYDIAFTDLNTGWVAGLNGIILKTTNGGTNWVQQTAPVSVKILKIQPVNSNTVYAAGFVGSMFKTTNGGINWQSLPGFTSDDIYGLNFVNENTGWACGVPNIYRTTNGGMNWEQQTIPALSLYGVHFLNENTGWTAGSVPGLSGIISKTTNGGAVWETQYTGSDWFFCLNFKDANTGYSAGFDGAYVKTTNGGDPLTAVEPPQNTPSEFSLMGNYPNPFNPVTNIKFSLPAAGNVVIRIYDITGRFIDEPVNSEFTAGTHSVSFDGSALASGVYLYRLTSSGHTAVKKMILTK